tara:strand:- start:178 stop:1104 length:927 start_codon:yes stop_codon:yes gene_type:complete
MCLLVLQKENTRLTEKELQNSDDSNPDGIGYSFVKDEKLIIRKFRKFSKFLKGYDRDISRYGHQSPFLLHFRLATHGVNIGTENVHPFKVRNDLVFGHNGIISDVTDDDKLSDTQMFNKEVLKELPLDFLENTAHIKLISGFIGNSKLVFLDSKKNFSIINEDMGHWNDEETIWFSNNGYCETKYYNYGNYGSYGASVYGWNQQKSVSKKNNNTGLIVNTALKNAKDRIKYGWEDDFENADDLTFPNCDWCGMESGDLKECDVTDFYNHEDYDVVTAKLCPECVRSDSQLLNKDRKLLEGGSDDFDLC